MTAIKSLAAAGSAAFIDAIKARRSVYALNDNLPITKEKVVELVQQAILHCPSSFNSQTTRAIILFGEEHHKLWAHTLACLTPHVSAKGLPGTTKKINSFSAGAGTVLLFEDQRPIEKLQKAFPSYKDGFPQWSEHAAGIVHFTIWTALANEGVGGNLQHYSPLIDQGVKEMFGAEEEWVLKAQLVFGGIEAPAGEKTFEPVEERVKVRGL